MVIVATKKEQEKDSLCALDSSTCSHDPRWSMWDEQTTRLCDAFDRRSAFIHLIFAHDCSETRCRRCELEARLDGFLGMLI